MDTKEGVSAERSDLARAILGRVADKWSIAVLCTLADAPDAVRFSRLRDAVGGVTQKVLTSTLRHLEEDGFVTRRVHAAVPPRVDYALTSLGAELYQHIVPLQRWAESRTAQFTEARDQYRVRGEATTS